MRTLVTQLVALGQLPGEKEATATQVQEFEEVIRKIEPPLTKEEAVAMLAVFGQDGCFGLAWSLLHLIEISPGWPYPEARLMTANPWVKSMLERAK